ncbi:MAG: 1,4-alpha-glucan branching protein GlgB, partial [Verrucomicrobia bacterium]|nr:1,4-alpha-glucan branching protein GlgB [Verrucomicrobiota bacterium]
EASKAEMAGFFEYLVPKDLTSSEYRVFHQNGLLAHDPYIFWPTFGEIDQHLFGRGVHYNLHRQMGARLTHHQGVSGVKFTVWAPSARAVSLVGDFNFWNGSQNPMRSLGGCGVWELFVPGLTVGEKYKFEIRTQSGQILLKADPYALASELRPRTASVVATIDSHVWNDSDWMERRKTQGLSRPMAIYEVHLGSWKREHGHFLNYRQLAHDLTKYCLEMGFTHVELMPITEHPLDESWGYQVTGFFAVTSRFGSPSDFQYFVDHLHQNGIGVIVDWVPGHFPTDDFSLARFDGTSLYEHEDPRQGFHPHWNTAIFNFGRVEVTNFLIASALFFLDIYHIDGLRVDAVASMLYLDYGRDGGEWIPNRYGGKENIEAIEFLRHSNSIIHQQYPGVLTIAEESTSFGGVSHPLEHHGLGFDFKWNMGWMNDTLRYIEKAPIFRCYHQQELTFGLLYAFSEKFVLVLSHDEVVHGKKSLLSKMPGDMWQQFANLRLLYSYMICQPGKKLLFMGGEIGQWNEWSCNREMEWFLLDFPLHQGLQRCVKELNHCYVKEKALWADDYSYHGFEWVDFRDEKNSVISYLRKSHEGVLLCIHNFTPQYHHEYYLPTQGITRVEEIFNSDDERYGGSGKVKGEVKVQYNGALQLSLAPLATAIYRVYY